MSASPQLLPTVGLSARLRQCLIAEGRSGSPVLYQALVALSRHAGWSTPRLRAHQRYLAAWLNELLDEGDEERADQLVAQLAAAERVLGQPVEGALTLNQVVAERTRQGDSAADVAGEVVLACPSRLKRHWDRVFALAVRAAVEGV